MGFLMPINETVINDAIEINRRLFYDLWNISNVSGLPTGLSPRLILPKKRNQELRISEQEARFLYVGLLNTLNYFYSVETPTEQVYTQKGQTPQSGASDLSLYIQDKDQMTKVMNVEFKAHNPVHEDIRKDIEKLMVENIPGNWCHLLKNINSRSIPVLFDKFARSLNDCWKMFETSDVSILFSVCVLEKKWASLKYFDYNESVDNFKSYVQNFFDLRYSIKSGRIEVTKDAGWTIIN
jgi:hypothetical protein